MMSGTLIVGLRPAGNRKARRAGADRDQSRAHSAVADARARLVDASSDAASLGAGVSSLLSETIGMIFAIVYVARRPAYRIFSELDDFARSVACGLRCWACPKRCSCSGSCCPTSLSSRCSRRSARRSLRRFARSTSYRISLSSVPSPLQSAAQTVIGQRLGAGDVEGARCLLRARAASHAADHVDRRRGGCGAARGRLRSPSRLTPPSRSSPHSRSRCT